MNASTIAGSMISVAAVTFSITMVAVTSAAGQYGPRLIGNFMRDRGNQFTLGMFTSTFIYCLLILRVVRTGVGNITGNVGRQLRRDLEMLYPEGLGEGPQNDDPDTSALEPESAIQIKARA